jgi:hypothetical protein
MLDNGFKVYKFTILWLKKTYNQVKDDDVEKLDWDI